jgi:hypothetical protein
VIRLAMAEHSQVEAVRPTTTIYADRLALSLEDRAGQLWTIHVLREPRVVVGAALPECAECGERHAEHLSCEDVAALIAAERRSWDGRP